MVSIGMPTYNQAKYLRTAINSILNQSYEDLELIISNNKSSDHTDDICREYANNDKRVIYYGQDKNTGPISNFDFVLSKARGEYFFWAASDDIFSENWIDELLPKMGPDVKLSVGRIIDISKDGRILRAWDTKDYLWTNKIIRSSIYYLSNKMEGNYVHGVFRTDYLRMLGGMKRYGWAWPGTDRMLIYHVILDGKIRTSNSAILYKRVIIGAESKGANIINRTLISLVRLNYINFVKMPQAIRLLNLLLFVPKTFSLILALYKRALESYVK